MKKVSHKNISEILISIIIPCFNSEKYINNCLNSVLNQTHKNLEIIIIEDYSNDNTYSILSDFSKIDSRIILLKNSQNLGVSYSRNLGLSIAKGDYICFLDSDDIWDLHKVEKQLGFMLKKECSLSYTLFTIFDDDSRNPLNNLPDQVNFDNLLFGNSIALSSTMLNRSSIKNLQFKKIGHEDYLFWLNYLRFGENGYLLRENLLFYRVHSKSISYNKFKAINFTWNIYRNELHFNTFKAGYFFIIHIFNSFKKRFL